MTPTYPILTEKTLKLYIIYKLICKVKMLYIKTINNHTYQV